MFPTSRGCSVGNFAEMFPPLPSPASIVEAIELADNERAADIWRMILGYLTRIGAGSTKPTEYTLCIGDPAASDRAKQLVIDRASKFGWTAEFYERHSQCAPDGSSHYVRLTEQKT